MIFSRKWAMPNHNTFEIADIANFVQRYLFHSTCSVDPFARDNKWATYSNDLNNKTSAQYHMDAVEFLKLLKYKRVIADLVIFDPPYSTRQLKECYDNIDRKMRFDETQAPHSAWRKEINEICSDDAMVLSFGWNTVGMGKKYGFEIIEIMLVCHGGMRNDTICMAEQRTQGGLF